MTFSALLLRAGAQLGGERGVGRGIRAPRAGALDRTRPHDAALDARGTARGSRSASATSPHRMYPPWCAGLARAQAAVRLRRIARAFVGCRHLEPRREAQLIGVPLADRVAAPFDEAGVLRRASCAAGRRRRMPRGGCRGAGMRRPARQRSGARAPPPILASAAGATAHMRRRAWSKAAKRSARSHTCCGMPSSGSRDRSAGARRRLARSRASPPTRRGTVPRATRRTVARRTARRAPPRHPPRPRRPEAAPAGARIAAGIQPEGVFERRAMGGEEALRVRPAVRGATATRSVDMPPRLWAGPPPRLVVVNEFLTWLLDVVQSVDPVVRTLLAGLAIMLETSVLIGLVVPGDTVVIVAATAVASPLEAVLLGVAVVIGALIGESIGFWLGRWLGPKIRDSWVGRRVGARELGALGALPATPRRTGDLPLPVPAGAAFARSAHRRNERVPVPAVPGVDGAGVRAVGDDLHLGVGRSRREPTANSPTRCTSPATSSSA